MTEESKISARQQRRLEKGQETIKTAEKMEQPNGCKSACSLFGCVYYL